MGFSSLNEIVGLIIGCNMLVFALSVLLTGHAMKTKTTLSTLRLHRTGQVLALPLLLHHHPSRNHSPNANPHSHRCAHASPRFQPHPHSNTHPHPW